MFETRRNVRFVYFRYKMSTTRERYLEWRIRDSTIPLPVEIWAEIFAFLSVDDLFSVRLVSRRFYSCVNEHTKFWSSVIVDLDNWPSFKIHRNRLKSVRLSNLDILTKSKVYNHCQVYLRPKKLRNNASKRKRSSSDQNENSKDESFLRCTSVYFRSFASWTNSKLESMLSKNIEQLAFFYEFSRNEPSLNFLLNLRRLKYLKISFVHAIHHIDAFSIMLINTMRQIVSLTVRLHR